MRLSIRRSYNKRARLPLCGSQKMKTVKHKIIYSTLLAGVVATGDDIIALVSGS